MQRQIPAGLVQYVFLDWDGVLRPGLLIIDWAAHLQEHNEFNQDRLDLMREQLRYFQFGTLSYSEIAQPRIGACGSDIGERFKSPSDTDHNPARIRADVRFRANEPLLGLAGQHEVDALVDLGLVGRVGTVDLGGEAGEAFHDGRDLLSCQAAWSVAGGVKRSLGVQPLGLGRVDPAASSPRGSLRRRSRRGSGQSSPRSHGWPRAHHADGRSADACHLTGRQSLPDRGWGRAAAPGSPPAARLVDD